MNDTVGAIVLAAGFSHRFGSVKLCAELDGGITVFEQTLSRIRAALPRTLVVTRPELGPTLAAMTEDLILFHQAERGMGATLAFAVSEAADWDAGLICLADMPFITSDTYRQVASALEPNNIVIPHYHERPGNPVGFGRRFFPELMRLTGDSGGRPVLKAHPDAIRRIPVHDAAILADIDTPDDLRRYQDAEKADPN